MTRGKENPDFTDASSRGVVIQLETKFRWKRGPQFGERFVAVPYEIDGKGKKHYKQNMSGGFWAWFNWRGRRIEGPDIWKSPKLEATLDGIGRIESVGFVLAEGQTKSIVESNNDPRKNST